VVHRQRSEELAAWLDRLVPLLFIGGLVLAFIEIKMPGFGLPGIGSIACFALLLFGRYLVGLADIPHLVVVAVGVILVAVEIFLVPGTLWAGVLGGLLVIGGLIWANLGPGYGLEYPLDRDLAIDSAFETMLWSAFAAVMMLVISRYLPRTPIMNRLVLDAGGSGAGTSPGDASGAHEIVEALRPGTLGTALTDLRPVGKVQLDGDGREFEASCPGGALESGTRIAVIRIHATGRLEVEAAGAETPGPVGSRSS
jgi:membrane-bound serine protease (ClpP class)